MDKSLSTKTHGLFVAFVASWKWGMSNVGISVFEAGLLSGQCAWGHSRSVLEEMAAGDFLLLGYGELGNAPAEVGAWKDKTLAVVVLCRLTKGLSEESSIWPPTGSEFYDDSHIFRIGVEEMHRWEMPDPVIVDDEIMEGFRESSRRLGAPYRIDIDPTGTAFDTQRVKMTPKPILPIPHRRLARRATDPTATVKMELESASGQIAPANPPWTNDELVLVLDLYLRLGLLAPAAPSVEELRNVLNQLPVHRQPIGRQPFRDTHGVSRKLANFAALDRSYRGSDAIEGDEADKQIWKKFARDPQVTQVLAMKIELLATTRIPDIQTPTDGEEEVLEGRIVFREHRLQERNQQLITRKIGKIRDNKGRIRCQVCRFNFEKTYGRRGEGFLEAHHLVPLDSPAPRVDSTDDLILVCANCHCMIHRSEPWLTPKELRAIVTSSKR